MSLVSTYYCSLETVEHMCPLLLVKTNVSRIQVKCALLTLLLRLCLLRMTDLGENMVIYSKKKYKKATPFIASISHYFFPLGWLLARIIVISTKAVERGIGWEAQYFSLFLNAERKSRFERSNKMPCPGTNYLFNNGNSSVQNLFADFKTGQIEK